MDYSTTVIVLTTAIATLLSCILIFLTARFFLKRNASRIYIYVVSVVILSCIFPVFGFVDLIIQKDIFSKYNVWYQLNEYLFDNLGNLMWERSSVPCEVLNEDHCDSREDCFYYVIDDTNICTSNKLE